jgi:hypothetical protein
MYRSNYPYESQQSNSDKDFFKSLEGFLPLQFCFFYNSIHFILFIQIERASSSQKTTIGRPKSLNSSSTFSLPTPYHQNTSAYSDYNMKNEIDDYNFDDNSFNNSDDDMSDVVEAFNFNVQVKCCLYIFSFIPILQFNYFGFQIPRPKIQLNQSKLFNFGKALNQ